MLARVGECGVGVCLDIHDRPETLTNVRQNIIKRNALRQVNNGTLSDMLACTLGDDANR